MYTVSSVPTLNHYLQRAVYWYVKDDNTFLASTSGERDDTNALVPGSMLEECHPDFANTLRGMIHFNYMHSRARAEGRMVVATRDYLLGEFSEMTTASGNRKMLTQVSDIEPVSGSDKVWVSGQTITLKHTTGPYGLISFVMHSDWMRYTVCANELDKQYAGWSARFTVATGLGLQGRELVGYVLSKKPALESVVPDLTFE